jgi:hypothetical protein
MRKPLLIRSIKRGALSYFVTGNPQEVLSRGRRWTSGQSERRFPIGRITR